MASQAAELAASWHSGQIVQMKETMVDLAATNLARSIFSSPLAEHAVAEVHESLPVLAKNLIPRTVMPKVLDHVPIPANRRFDKAADRMRNVIDEVIAQYHAHPEHRDDLLSLLMAARHDSGATMSDEQIRDEAITLLFAGTETSAAFMAWALYELARNPGIDARVHTEITTVAGDGLITQAKAAKLTYLRQVLHEVMRLHGGLLVMRHAHTAVTLGGVDIPAGTEIVYSPHGMHRDPRVFPDPLRFDPDRWLPETAAKIPTGACLPFSAGRHQCVGESFGWTEMTIALATILRDWQLTIAPGKPPKETVAGIVQLNRLPMIVQPRHQTPHAPGDGPARA
ncbi:cytochrome P450 [Streptomyces chattanoogensis]|uniref:cytochrome P450 n=1 Tax=Streptomyces chattanoogensis TaxID=66876 RepID=UPI0006B61A3E|nr:cytochrome P450 [Streptomyces chattanoogensis]